MRVLRDGYKGSVEENNTYGVSVVLWDYSWRSVEVFSDGVGIGMADGGHRLCVWIKMQ